MRSPNLNNFIPKILCCLIGGLLLSKALCQNKFKARPKIATFEFNRLPVEEEESGSFITNANLRFPVILGDRVMVFGEFKYKSEEIGYAEAPQLEGRDDIELRNYSSSFIYRLNFTNKLSFLGNVRLGSGSDTGLKDFNAVWTTSNVLRYRINDRVMIGTGVRYQKSPFNTSVLPIALYQHDFGDKWQFSALLPKEIKVTRMAKPESILYAQIEVQAASYFLQDNAYAHQPTEYRRLGADFRVGIERELHDWLWFGAYTGFGLPFSTGVRNPITGESYHSSYRDMEPIVGLSLFIVPPMKWL